MRVYDGAKNKVVQTLKKLSVANMAFALGSAPLIQYITSASGMGGKGVAMSSLLIFFGGGTTYACHWATTTYVLSMDRLGSGKYSVITPTFTGGEKETIIDFLGTVPSSSVLLPREVRARMRRYECTHPVRCGQESYRSEAYSVPSRRIPTH